VFLSLFGLFSQLAHAPSVVALQDPPLYRGKPPSFQFYSCFSPPGTGNKKPRVARYVSSSFLSTITLLARFFDWGDIMPLDLFTPPGFFNPSMTTFTIINSYSTKGQSNDPRWVPPDLIFQSLPGLRLPLCDSNITRNTGDPLTNIKEHELATSVTYFDKATYLAFCPLNTHGVYTHFSMSLVDRPLALDLAFAHTLLIPYFLE